MKHADRSNNQYVNESTGVTVGPKTRGVHDNH